MKLNLNPYLSHNLPYFNSLKDHRILQKLTRKVYDKYDHQCQICKESLYNGEKVEIHLIKPISEGGNSALKNLIPLHRMCHDKVTHQKQNANKLKIQ